MARLSRDSLLRVGVFLATVILVVAGSTAAPLLTDRGIQEQDHPAFESGLVPDRPSDDGTVELERAEGAGGVIVIDDSHINRFDREEIQPLVDAISSAGYRVEYVPTDGDVTAALKGADGLIVIDPAREYEPDEVAAIEGFVGSGGRLVMFGEPPRSQLSGGLFSVTISTIRSNLDRLSAAFGIEFGESPLYNTAENEGNFRNVFARSRGGSPLGDGVERTAFYTASSVTTTQGRSVLVATDGTRMTRGDTPGQFPVAVRSGNVVAVGDTTFLESDNFNVVDNDRFIENIARFLIAGDRRQGLLEYPDVAGPAPVVRYTEVAFLDPAQSIASDLRANGQDPTLSLRRGSTAGTNADVLITSYDHLANNDVGVTSLRVENDRVGVEGYESGTTGVIVFHAPRSEIDLLVVVDGPTRARKAADVLVNGELEQYAINRRTAVLRTASAGPSDADGAGDDTGDGTDNGNGNGNANGTGSPTNTTET